MAEAIILYIWILIDCDIDDDISPSIIGLVNLYTWQTHANKSPGPKAGPWYQSIMSCDFPVMGIDLVFHVLSGISVKGTPPKNDALPMTEHLARVGNGICVYYQAVEDLSLPLNSISRLRAVHGYITHSGYRYKSLGGMKDVYMTKGLEVNDFQGQSTINSVRISIQKTDEEERLKLAYLARYIAKGGQTVSDRIHLPYFPRKLQRFTRDKICAKKCSPLYEDQSFFEIIIHVYHGSIRRLLQFVDKDCVDEAQEFLNKLNHSAEMWMLLDSHGIYRILINQPLLLYSMISNFYQVLGPFKQCLSCVIAQNVHPLTGATDDLPEPVTCKILDDN